MSDRSPTAKKGGALLPVVLGGAAGGGGKHHFTRKKSGQLGAGSKKYMRLPSDESAGSSTRRGKMPLSTLFSATQGTERQSRRTLWVLFAFACALCSVCLVSLYMLVQENGISNGTIDANTGTSHGFLSAWRKNKVISRLQGITTWFSKIGNKKIHKEQTKEDLHKLSDYECVGWRQTMNCTPSGLRESENDRNCSEVIPNGLSGYCEVKHKHTGEIKHVMQMHCDSLRPGVNFRCDMFQSLLGYSIMSTDYIHDQMFSFEKNQEDFRIMNHIVDTPIPIQEDGVKNQSVGELELSFDRAIVMVIYQKLLLSTYVSIRSMRAMGCTLPVEMWYKREETDVEHPLLKLLVAEFGVYLREIDNSWATRFYTKLHAVYYSAFDNILLLDADNFPVRDPTYLFDTKEFVEHGAMFWPDFWRPGNTIFNIQEHSFVWDIFGLPFVNMFEQESGQVLINRRKTMQALNVLMYYGFSMPRIHEEMRVVWGDKDLFRFAWMKSKTPFYMIPRPAGSAGTKHADYDLFCGVTMVQHDPDGEIVFFHRNTEKLLPSNDRVLWTHVQQYKRSSKLKDYFVRGANGGKVFPQFRRCFGKDVHYERLFTLKPITAFPFENLERDLLKFAKDGAAIAREFEEDAEREEAEREEAEKEVDEGDDGDDQPQAVET